LDERVLYYKEAEQDYQLAAHMLGDKSLSHKYAYE
jgi:hypothetical protein